MHIMLSILLAHETEVEQLLKKEQEFFKGIADTPNRTLNKPPQQSKIKVTKKFSSTSHVKENSKVTNHSERLKKYVEHMKKQGVKTLTYIVSDVMKNMKQDDINIKINNASNIFKTKLQDYFNFITGPKAIAIFDKKFVLLDICELACRILYHQQKKMLTDVIVSANISNEDTDYSTSVEGFNMQLGKSHKDQLDIIRNITDTIFKYNTNLRKKEIKYICKIFKICRPYPALTDYCGYFLSEILRLPDTKFRIMSKLLGVILKINDDIITIISEITNYDKFAHEVDRTCNDEIKIKESLEFFKDIFSQKFNIIRNPDLNLNMRASAIRILLDFIDKSFKGKQHDDFITNFDATVTNIGKWAYNEIPSIALGAGNLCNKVFNLLYHFVYSIKTDKKYLRILFEMIREGNSTDYINSYMNNNLIKLHV